MESAAKDATNGGVIHAAKDVTNGVTHVTRRRQRDHWQRGHGHEEHHWHKVITWSDKSDLVPACVKPCMSGGVENWRTDYAKKGFELPPLCWFRQQAQWRNNEESGRDCAADVRAACGGVSRVTAASGPALTRI